MKPIAKLELYDKLLIALGSVSVTASVFACVLRRPWLIPVILLLGIVAALVVWLLRQRVKKSVRDWPRAAAWLKRKRKSEASFIGTLFFGGTSIRMLDRLHEYLHVRCSLTVLLCPTGRAFQGKRLVLVSEDSEES